MYDWRIADFKAGDRVSWVFSRRGSEVEKGGTVVCYVPSDEKASDICKELRGVTRVGMFSSKDRYIVLVDTVAGKSVQPVYASCASRTVDRYMRGGGRLRADRATREVRCANG